MQGRVLAYGMIISYANDTGDDFANLTDFLPSTFMQQFIHRSDIADMRCSISRGQVPNPNPEEVAKGRATVYDTWVIRMPQNDANGKPTGKPR